MIIVQIQFHRYDIAEVFWSEKGLYAPLDTSPFLDGFMFFFLGGEGK